MTDKDSGMVTSEYSCEGIASRQCSKASKEKSSATASVSRHAESRDEGISSNTPLHGYLRTQYDTMETEMQTTLAIFAEKLQRLVTCRDLKELGKIEHEIYDIVGEKVGGICKAIRKDLEPGVDSSLWYVNSNLYVADNRPTTSAITNRKCEQDSLLSSSLWSVFPGPTHHSTTDLIPGDKSILSSQLSADNVTNLKQNLPLTNCQTGNFDVLNTNVIHAPQHRATSVLTPPHPELENLTDIVSSDPSTGDSHTDLKQELLDNDLISVQSPIQETSKESDPGNSSLMTHAHIVADLKFIKVMNIIM